MSTSDEPGVTTYRTPNDLEIVATRVFAAPVELVWEVWTNPAHLPKWLLGPDGWVMTDCEIDLRPDGGWRYAWRNVDAGDVLETRGRYHEIDPPRLLAGTELARDGSPAAESTLTFTADAAGTLLTQRLRFGSVEARDAAQASAMAAGMDASFGRLDGYLQSIRPGPGGTDLGLDVLLELVPVPVADIDRALAFYRDALGWTLDVDIKPGDGVRIAQLTPPGSGCSILLSAGIPDVEMPVGSLRGPHLVVADIQTARQALLDRGVEVGEVTEPGQGVAYAAFTDPDGNTWLLQEMKWRAADFGPTGRRAT
ncbi:MAG TPA: SRPBCC domain-containing protein [Mycobacteriales bacterium]|nr:SRPBCC domain-containing protein [Mycobacteriales bacterium]